MSGDLDTGIMSLWNASGLDDQFRSLWVSETPDEYPTLHDQDATPTQPTPYCVFQIENPVVVSRMSGHGSIKREVRDYYVDFRVHTKPTAEFSGKEQAAALANEIKKVFGGHPVQSPATIELAHGAVLIVQYQTDFGIRTNDETYQWHVRYIIRCDVPFAI